MAEVKQNNKAKSKKSSKVLGEKQTLTNDELLEQIINKKKNKVKSGSSSARKKTVSTKTKSNTSNKRVSKPMVEVSSDDIYDKIKAKRTTKKRIALDKKEKSVELNKCVSEEHVKSVEDKFTKAIREINEENPDLIITREIRFDDLSSDLKNKKNLEELRNAIEEYDKLSGYDASNNSLKDDIEILPSIRYSNYKLRKNFVIFVVGFFLLVFIVGVIFGFLNFNTKGLDSVNLKFEDRIFSEEKRKKEEEKAEKIKLDKLYNECISKRVTEADYTDDIKNVQEDLTNYLKNNYSASVSYEDLMYGYSFNYNENDVYYAASTIKALSALYIYSNAAGNKINLNDTITYTSKFKVSYSVGVSKHKLGSEIKIRDLVKYSIIYSDNSAHQMLISYIGRSKLKEFGNSLGAKNTLNGGDNFGNTSSYDGLIYMKALNEFIENNGELGDELKEYFVTSQQNEIAVNNLEVAHKYGLYKKNYHNMGIVYDSSPYVVSIMTSEGANDRETIIADISQRVYDLHNLFKSNREKNCRVEVYSNEKSTNS